MRIKKSDLELILDMLSNYSSYLCEVIDCNSSIFEEYDRVDKLYYRILEVLQK